MNERLPGGWGFTYLENCALILDNFRQPISSKEREKRIKGMNKEKLYPYYGATGQVGLIDDYLLDGIYVLLGEDGAPFLDVYKRKAYIVKGKIWVNNHAHILDSLTSNHFLCHYLNQFDYRNYVSGTTRLKLTQSSLKRIPIKFPPLNEQLKIAAKLDKIMPRIERVKERLERIPVMIKRFRQSVLTAAVTGKLTEKWREQHPEVESAEFLIKKIKNEREKIFIMECEKATLEGRGKPSKYRQNNQPILNKNEISKWCWERLVNIAEISGGVTKGRNLNSAEVITLPYLRVANVQDGFLDLNEIKEIEIKINEKERYLLKENDILFTEGGDRDKLGRGTVWKNEIKDCIHQNHIFKARLRSINILPEYISLVTKSDFSKDYFQKVASQTVNLASINMRNLGDLPIPICPFEEQKEILRQVDRLFALADKMENHYKNAKEKIDKLPQAILAKAFRGELVRQDPNDEPAQVLLEKIEAQKALIEAENKTKHYKKKK